MSDDLRNTDVTPRPKPARSAGGKNLLKQVQCPDCGGLRDVYFAKSGSRCKPCQTKRQQTGRMQNCEQCGADFWVKKARIGRARWCSYQCKRDSGWSRKELGARLAITRRGAGNPAFKHGKRVGINPSGWKLTNKGGERVCRNCGTADGSIHLHHAIPRSKAPQLKEDLRNGVPLCAACHMGWHANKVTLYRSIFTQDEWEFLSIVELTGENITAWLDRRYPTPELDGIAL